MIVKDILEKFNKDFGYLVHLMKKTDHHSEKYVSTHHMEGDVWTHTMLCLNHFLNFKKTYNEEFLNTDIAKSVIFAILCHDIGKIYTRNIKDDNKVTFYNHASVSLKDTIQVLYGFKDFFTDFERVCNLVLPAVSVHIDLYNNSRKKYMYFNNNVDLHYVCEQLAIADANGSICLNKKFDHVEFQITPKYQHDQNVYVFCGAPASGKDYLAKQLDLPILSFDDIRTDIYKEHCYTDGLTEKEIYQKAWDYCNEININLMKELKRRKDKIKGDYCICNTNMTKKARRSLINQLGKANYHCLYVISDIHNLFDRNENRSSKTVPKDVIRRMLINQQTPSLKEGFTTVKIVCN
jgi:predicted kinase